ncbi:MAG: hypothetical protein L3K17_00030 [Thermoplasmata archaeon]|nr:hypothetical protein [Thermoplasmata archaeon]
MSPRKSSTSSAKPSPRPRYLGVEVAGDISPPRRWIEHELQRLLDGAAGPGAHPTRVIRWEERRGLVEIEHLDLDAARRAWNCEVSGLPGGPVRLTTRRTWGTLRKGKDWLRRLVPPEAAPSPPSRDV